MKTNPVAELRASLSDFADRCRSQSWFGPLFRVRVAQDIAADISAHQRRIADAAYSAEQSDLEAVKVLERAAADGFTNADLPEVERAIRLIRNSANKDHAISEAAA